MITVTCIVCNKAIKDYPSKARKFCSMSCRNLLAKQRYKEKRLFKNCLICSKEFPTILSRIKKQQGKYCSKKCSSLAQSDKMKGKGNPLWLGGISSDKERLRTYIWNKIKKNVYKRDGHTCKICGVSNIKVSAHHIIPYRISKDDSMENLITVCNSCHKKEDWKYRNVIRKGDNIDYFTSLSTYKHFFH